MNDPRRAVPRTDRILADPRLTDALRRHPREVVKAAVATAQRAARAGGIGAEDVIDLALASLPSGFADVINATGVVLHTNLGRAPLGPEAVAAVVRAASGYVDVEYDLASGRRARRGRTAEDALRVAVPAAEAALVVNNGAAALVLAAAAAAGDGSIAVSRGELVEIGDGFRLTSILAAAGVRLVEVGATNRTTVSDYRDAVAHGAAAVLKVHPSNFRVEGFTSSVPVRVLAQLGVPVVVDVGSGLLRPDPLLPDEPDVTAALVDGSDVVTFSGDKLLGGPQAGVALGRTALVERMRRHPLARAFRADKLTLAALGATVTSADSPVWRMLRTADLEARARAVADRVPGAEVVAVSSPVGGGSGTGVDLPSWAVAVDESYAVPLRTGTPAVVGRLHEGRLLLDLRTVPPDRDPDVTAALKSARSTGESDPPAGPTGSSRPVKRR
ncbi:MAG TPA: L-seryl-tRNA(Sec) selenium transferase [Mycobacteriales bacterium]|nr:L-seryl-tRNA(Sec) selenium transferase [Mycobacteriales bacterium]